MGARAVSKRTSLVSRMRASRLVQPAASPGGRSLMPKGLKQKLIVSFSLMSVVPLLVLCYIVVNYVFPQLKSVWDITLIMGVTTLIALLGFSVARGLVLPVIKMATEVQDIAAGHLDHQVDVRAPDEVGALGMALNQVTQRVRENMSQLRVYGEQTKHLNLEINQRIMALSHLLQVSTLIAQSAKVEEIIAFILEKLTQMGHTELNCLLEPAMDENTFVVRAAAGIEPHQAKALINARFVAPWLWKALREQRMLTIDGRSSPRERGLIREMFGMTNAVCQPLTSIGQGIGFLISANRKENFTFEEEDMDFLKIFAKQLAIAIENDLLIKRAEELKVIDDLTGLYNSGYIKSRLEEEIRRARRHHRSCSLVVFNLDNFRKLQELYGGLTAEGILCQVAELLKSHVSEVDRVGRMGQDEFVAILPERNKREAIELAEAFRRKIEEHVFSNGPQQLSRVVTLSAGVSENPLDGATSEELFEKANDAVRVAKKEGRNRVVAPPPGFPLQPTAH